MAWCSSATPRARALLNRLIQEEIDGDDTRRERLVSAILLGSSVVVPDGEDVGGDFANIPRAGRRRRPGAWCLVASFRSTAPPGGGQPLRLPPLRRLRRSPACVNPAALAGGPADLDNVFPATTSPWADPATGAEITTPFYSMPGMVTGECVQEGGFSYLRDGRTATV